jgi:hypothetical protein
LAAASFSPTAVAGGGGVGGAGWFCFFPFRLPALLFAVQGRHLSLAPVDEQGFEELRASPCARRQFHPPNDSESTTGGFQIKFGDSILNSNRRAWKSRNLRSWK